MKKKFRLDSGTEKLPPIFPVLGFEEASLLSPKNEYFCRLVQQDSRIFSHCYITFSFTTIQWSTFIGFRCFFQSYKVDGFVGTFGFISSMTDHFCAGCNRIRLTADGHLKVCLFDTNEVNLLKLLRNEGCPSKAEDVELLIEQTVRDAVSKKFFSHGGICL